MAAKYPSEMSEAQEDSLNCLICTEPYNEPKVLPCQHMFCNSCLERYYNTCQEEKKCDPGTFPCPICRQVVTVPDKGVQEFKTGQIQELVQKATGKKAKKIHCDVCKYKKLDVIARDHCPSCGINYCDTCSKDHNRHCLFQNHSVIPVAQMDKSALRCEAHEAEVVKYYCATCNVPLCTVCAVTSHNGHQTLEMNTALGNKKDNIETRIAGMSDRVMRHEEVLAQLEDIQNIREAAMKKSQLEIERHVASLIAQLEVRKENLIQELDKSHNAANKQINIEKDNLAFELANMKSLWKFAAKLTEPTQSLQLLAMHDDVMAMVKSMSLEEPKFSRDSKVISMFVPKLDMSVGCFQRCELTSDIVYGLSELTDTSTQKEMKTVSYGDLYQPSQSYKWHTPRLTWKVRLSEYF